MNDVINLSDYRKTPTANVTDTIVNRVATDYESSMLGFNANTENFEVAADIALIKFLMRGAAHRVSGETHPSQMILDSIHKNMS